MALIPSANGVSTIPGFAGNMYNRPTIVPIANGQNQPVMETDPYFAIEVDTTGVTDITKIVLFDPSRLYQLATNYSLPIGVNIIGKTTNYQAIMNDTAHVGSYFDIIKMRIVVPANQQNDNGCCGSSDLAQAQFANSISIYETGKSEPKLIKTIYPDMGIHEGQYQLNINTFMSPTTMTNRRAWVYNQEPGIRLFWGFYQKAEIGRQQ